MVGGWLADWLVGVVGGAVVVRVEGGCERGCTGWGRGLSIHVPAGSSAERQ